MYRTREPWHLYSIDKVEYRLKTDLKNGLEPRECRARLGEYGQNALFLLPKASRWGAFTQIFSDPALLLLLMVIAIALVFRRYAVALCPFCVLLVSTVVSVLIAYRSERIRDALCSYSAPRVRALRGARLLLTDAAALVPGDIVFLREGDVVPCDGRIISLTSDFCVMTLQYDERGRVLYTPNGKTWLPVEEDAPGVSPLMRENMVFCGSFVQTGEARIIVTATGRDTCLAAYRGDHFLAKDVGSPQSLTLMRRYMNRYSLLLCIALLPVCIASFFAASGNFTMLDILLLALSLVVSCMNEQLLSVGKTLYSSAVLRASRGGKRRETAILKQSSVVDALNRIDRLFLFGRAALFDGMPHFSALYASGTLFSSDTSDAVPPAAIHLAETAYRYESGLRLRRLEERTLPGSGATSLYDGIIELCDCVQFDRASSDIRAQGLRLLPDGAVEVTLNRKPAQSDASGGEEQTVYRIRRDSNPDTLLVCPFYVSQRRAMSLPPQVARQLYAQATAMRDNGMQVWFYYLEQNGMQVFEGMVGFAEIADPYLAENRLRLLQNGVHTALFLEEDTPGTVRELTRAGWLAENGAQDCIHAAEARIAGKPLAAYLNEKTTFLGFSPEEIRAMYETCKKNGEKTASLGIRHREAPLMNPATVCFTCEARVYSSDAPDEGESILTLDSIARVACECDQSIRRNSDVLVRRAGAGGGGLAGVANALHTARSFHFCMMLAMQYLMVVQFLRMTLVSVPLLFGMAVMSPAEALISGLWVDLGFVLCFALCRCSDSVLRQAQDFTRFFVSPIKTRPDWVVAALADGVFTVALGVSLTSAGKLAAGQGMELFFSLSLFYSQLCMLLCLLRCAGPFRKNLRGMAGVVLVTTSVLAAVAMTVFLPPLAGLLQLEGVSARTLLLPLFSPCALLLFYFLSSRFRKPLVRFVSSRVRGLLFGQQK